MVHRGICAAWVSCCADCRLQKLPMQPVLRRKSKPVYPEDLEEGLMRYSRAMQEIAHSFAGHTVLVVTHGEVRIRG